MVVGIISNQSALSAQSNLARANSAAGASISRLSSGNRIVKASDDVAGLAVGTVLKTNVSTLRTALKNAGQASSLLSIADGGLQNISDILQRQKSLAIQANSGSLSDNERAFLNEEFTSLTSEINRLIDSTTFNGIKLLDGSIFDGARVTSDTSNNNSTSGSLRLSVTGDADLADDEILIINGFTITVTGSAGSVSDSKTEVSLGDAATSAAHRSSLLAFLQNHTDPRIAAATYTEDATAGDIIINVDSLYGSNAGMFIVDAGTTAMSVRGGAEEAGAVQTVTGGALADGNYLVTGTVSDNIVKSLSNTAASSSVTLSASDLTGSAASTYLYVNGNTFMLVATASGAANEIVIDNAADSGKVKQIAAALNANTNAAVAVANYSTSGSVLQIDARTKTADMNFFQISTEDASGDIQSAVMASGAGTGVDVSRVTNNADFVGTISGFRATYVSSNTVNLQITVGDYTYSTQTISTLPGTDTTIMFAADDLKGGYFRVDLAANNGSSVSNQSEAELYAQRLDAALSGLSFQQVRKIDNWTGVGNIIQNTTTIGVLTGSSWELQNDNFTGKVIEDIDITAPVAGSTDATIKVTIDGEVFQTASGLGSTISIGQVVTLTSTTDPNHILKFYSGGTAATGTDAIQIDTDAKAKLVEAAFEEAFGMGVGSSGLDFQVGQTALDIITVSVESAETADIYVDNNGDVQALTIDTADNAQVASSVLDNAIGTVTAIRATVGALQSRFNFASANISSGIQNTEAARSEFLDADISEESTLFATAQVKLQASISVLAQANQLPQNLLKLIG